MYRVICFFIVVRHSLSVYQIDKFFCLIIFQIQPQFFRFKCSDLELSSKHFDVPTENDLMISRRVIDVIRPMMNGTRNIS